MIARLVTSRLSFRSRAIGCAAAVDVVVVAALAASGLELALAPILAVAAGLAVIAAGALAAALLIRQRRLICYLEGSLDAIALPVTVTDMDMKWVFVNKLTEQCLAAQRLTKETVLGKHCSNWKADICGTANCGIASLRNGVPRTHYHQKYPDRPSTYMQVDTSYIHDELGRRIGHVEVVTDVDAADRLKATAERVAAGLEETSASLVELSASTKQTAQNSTEANSLMTETEQVAAQADSCMSQLTTAMDEISAASKETSRIVKTIDEISFQTNILALNAAVEAARAGEAGLGFAVVADEVRSLAHRAADSAKNTADLIEKTVNKVRDGGELVSRTNEIFKQVLQSSTRAKERIGQIATAAQEQSDGIQQITAAVADMENTVLSRGVEGGEAASRPPNQVFRKRKVREQELVSLPS